MDQRLQECREQADDNYKELATRLDKIETSRKRTPDHVEDNESRANNRSPLRRQAQHSTLRTRTPNMSSVKIDVTSFDGRLDP